jgi:hypothetical protein
MTVPLLEMALLRNQFACFSQDPGKKKGKKDKRSLLFFKLLFSIINYKIFKISLFYV